MTIPSAKEGAPQMNRSRIVLTVGLASAMLLSGGCANSQKEEAEAAEQRYKLLNGSTSDQVGRNGKPLPEPEVNANTRFAAGRLAESTGKLDAAMMQYQQALIADRNHIPSLYRLGIVLTRTRHFDRAAVVWKQYIKATHDSANGYSNLGFCYEMAGDVANAEEAYKQGFKRDPKHEPCRVNYGLMLARQGRIEEAEEQLSAVLKADEVAFNIAAIYADQGKTDLARAELTRALEVNPKNTAAQEKLATLPQE
jgi:tetratricopeptide (TPR) repeat protein